MLLVMPAVAYLTLRRGRNPLVKLIGLAVIAAGFYEFLGTGSRGGLISLIVTALYILKKGSPRLRMGLILGIPLLFASLSRLFQANRRSALLPCSIQAIRPKHRPIRRVQERFSWKRASK